MNRLKKQYFLPLFLLLLAACTRQVEDPAVAQAKIRQIQTRSFVGCESKSVMKGMVAILQDQGYSVKNVNSEIGILTAERNIDVERFSSKFFAVLFSGSKARWKKHSLVELTSNLSDQEGRTQVRITFLVRVFDNLGRVVEVKQVLEEEQYAAFFAELQKGLLLSSQKL